MWITMCKSKIHRATVTDANLNYIGSITIDEELMEKADILPYERCRLFQQQWCASGNLCYQGGVGKG